MSLPAGAVVSTEWLAAHLGSPGLRVVDIRGKVLPPGQTPRYQPKRAEYDAGHVPGAVFVDWTRDIVDLEDPVPAQLARADAFAARMGELGVGDRTAVVAYDDYRQAFAGRLAWALRFYGHADVRILDGGWSRWTAEGRPVSADVPRLEPARFTPRAQPSLHRTA
ncbi:MAG TPA: rhodanese-like domain-containing protein, partial [Polyangiaceae bacterium]|nr:rhodanese-like domain-containing protein [Polyangiaceae bacterium]